MNLPELIGRYEQGTMAVLDALGEYQDKNLDSKHPEGWSPRQIIHHLADSESNSYIRLRRLIAEAEGVLLSGYDEGAWSKNPTLGYELLPIDNSLAVFLAVRKSSLEIINRLSDADLRKSGIHSEVGKYPMSKWFTDYTAHPFDHADQITRAFQGEI